MSFIEAISTVFRKYFDYTGRARRKEYWYFQLFFGIVMIAAAFITNNMTGELQYSSQGDNLFMAVAIILYLPFISVTARRLHDTGRSGWWQLIQSVPIVGLILLYWLIIGSEDGNNKYGERPY